MFLAPSIVQDRETIVLVICSTRITLDCLKKQHPDLHKHKSRVSVYYLCVHYICQTNYANNLFSLALNLWSVPNACFCDCLLFCLVSNTIFYIIWSSTGHVICFHQQQPNFQTLGHRLLDRHIFGDICTFVQHLELLRSWKGRQILHLFALRDSIHLSLLLTDAHTHTYMFGFVVLGFTAYQPL